MNAVVCDASVLFKLLVAEPGSDRAFALAENWQLVVPQLALIEVGNALWRRVRSNDSTLETALSLFDSLHDLKMDVHSTDRLVPRALSIAVAFNHPIYDCVYLALAESLRAPVVTADDRFLSAARRNPLASVEIKALINMTN